MEVLWVVVAFGAALVSWAIATAKGRCGFCYFLLALLFWPLSLVLAVGLPSRLPPGGAAATIKGGACPQCGGQIPDPAAFCRHCGFTPAGAKPAPEKGFGVWPWLALLVLIGLAIYAWPTLQHFIR